MVDKKACMLYPLCFSTKKQKTKKMKKRLPILMAVTLSPQALRSKPILLAVTPLPRPLTTPPVTSTYFIFSTMGSLYLPIYHSLQWETEHWEMVFRFCTVCSRSRWLRRAQATQNLCYAEWKKKEFEERGGKVEGNGNQC